MFILPRVFVLDKNARAQKRRWEKRNPGETWPGYVASPKSRENQSKSLSKNPPMLGHKHKEETKELLSKALSGENNPRFGVPGHWAGKQLGDEHKKNIGLANSGEKHWNWQGGISHNLKVHPSIKVEEENYPIVPPGSRMEKVRIGSLLGDGLYTTQSGRFREGHCCEQKELVYVLANLHEPFFKWKETVMGRPLARVKTGVSNYHKKKYGIEVLHYHVSLPVFPCDHEAKKLWYPEGKKIVPDEILDKIDPQVLAWWFMGDGHYSKSFSIHSQGFLPKDQMKLVKKLKELGFNSTKLKENSKGRNFIGMYQEDAHKFLPLIAEYVVPSLRYKLGSLEPTYKAYNSHYYDPELVVTKRMLQGARDQNCGLGLLSQMKKSL